MTRRQQLPMFFDTKSIDELLDVFGIDKFNGHKREYPHNIFETKDGTHVLEIALAGFKKEDISVKIENDLLKIDVASDKDDDIEYIYKGIAKRQLHTIFTLGTRVLKDEISSKFENGMLTIEIPIDNKNKEITIM